MSLIFSVRVSVVILNIAKILCTNIKKMKIMKLDTGRYMPKCLTEWEQGKRVSTLVITENKTTLLCQWRNQDLMCAQMYLDIIRDYTHLWSLHNTHSRAGCCAVRGGSTSLCAGPGKQQHKTQIQQPEKMHIVDNYNTTTKTTIQKGNNKIPTPAW